MENFITPVYGPCLRFIHQAAEECRSIGGMAIAVSPMITHTFTKEQGHKNKFLKVMDVPVIWPEYGWEGNIPKLRNGRGDYSSFWIQIVNSPGNHAYPKTLFFDESMSEPRKDPGMEIYPTGYPSNIKRVVTGDSTVVSGNTGGSTLDMWEKFFASQITKRNSDG